MREVQKQQMDWVQWGSQTLNSISNHGTTFPRFSWVCSTSIRTRRRARRCFLFWRSILVRVPTGTWGRPGMALWRILVMGVLKQVLAVTLIVFRSCPTSIGTVREYLGHGAFAQDEVYQLQTIMDNVRLLTPQLLSAVGGLVVPSGHQVAGKKAWRAIARAL